jgi:hypothetical protein
MDLTDDQRRHVASCERAGCQHPALHEVDGGSIPGYCALCRAVEFGAEVAIAVELRWRHAACCEQAGCDHPPFRRDEALGLLPRECDRCRGARANVEIDPDLEHRLIALARRFHVDEDVRARAFGGQS